MTTPRVSVVIPVFNLAPFLPEAIESALGQTLPAGEREVIVVDDGSTDGSATVAARYAPAVRCIWQPNQGLSAARNAGIRAAVGRYIGFLDADDRWLPQKLAQEAGALDSNPEITIVHAGWRYIDGDGRYLPEAGQARLEGDAIADLLLGNALPVHAALIRRDPIVAVGGFDETLTAAEDWDLWLRLSLEGARWRAVPGAHAEYRMRPDAMHADTNRMLRNELRILDRLFAEPRVAVPYAALRAPAYQRAYLMAACARRAAGDRDAALVALRVAARMKPEFLADRGELRRMCRWLLAPGYRRESVVEAEWRRLRADLRDMLTSLFSQPDLEPAVARRRWSARLAYGLTVLRFRRRIVHAPIERRWRRIWRRIRPGRVPPRVQSR